MGLLRGVKYSFVQLSELIVGFRYFLVVQRCLFSADQDVKILRKGVVRVMSNCALCVVCDDCLCGSWWVCDKEIHGHDLLMLKRVRSKGSNSWKPTELKLAVT
jgi:hypothetical protein